MRRSVGTVPGILGLVWLRFRPKSGPKSKISGLSLKVFRALLAQPSAVGRVFVHLSRAGGIGPRTPDGPRSAIDRSWFGLVRGSSGQGFFVSGYTLGFLIQGFWAGWKSPIFGVWAAPAAPQKPFQKVGSFEIRRFPAGLKTMYKKPRYNTICV